MGGHRLLNLCKMPGGLAINRPFLVDSTIYGSRGGGGVSLGPSRRHDQKTHIMIINPVGKDSYFLRFAL